MGSWEYTTDPLVDISPEETCLAATKGRLDRCQACLGPRNPCLAVVLLATWFHFFFSFFLLLYTVVCVIFLTILGLSQTFTLKWTTTFSLYFLFNSAWWADIVPLATSSYNIHLFLLTFSTLSSARDVQSRLVLQRRVRQNFLLFFCLSLRSRSSTLTTIVHIQSSPTRHTPHVPRTTFKVVHLRMINIWFSWVHFP